MPARSVETRVEVLEHTVGEMKNEVTKMSAALTDFVKTRKDPTDFSSLIRTVAVTVAIVSALFVFLDNRYMMSGEGAADRAVLRYRVEQLEKHAVRPSISPRPTVLRH